MVLDDDPRSMGPRHETSDASVPEVEELEAVDEAPEFPEPWKPSKALLAFAEGALVAGRMAGLLPSEVVHSTLPRTGNHLLLPNSANIPTWLDLLEKGPEVRQESAQTVPSTVVREHAAAVVPRYDPPVPEDLVADSPAGDNNSPTPLRPSVSDPSAGLNMNQRLAFDVISQHRAMSKYSLNPKQLLMKVFGDAGTGKSTVIHAVSMEFERVGEGGSLIRCAHSGIAAVMICGSTICRIFHLTPRKVKSKGTFEFSQSDVKKLIAQWKGVKYIIIDEISQVRVSFCCNWCR